MKTELFKPCTIRRGDKLVRGMSIACGKCPQVGKVHINTVSNSTGNDSHREARMTARKFEEQGWFIGGSAGQHRCPTCQGASRVGKNALPQRPQPLKEFAQMVQHGPAVAPKPSTAPQPKPMGRDDRRIIFEKLNEVYLDEKTGYAPEWTDKRVGEDLGVPLAWVSAVRDEMFGPVSSNPDLDDKIAKAREVIADGRKLIDEIGVLKSTIDAQHERINAIVRQTAPLLDLVIRTERIMSDLAKTVRP